MKNAAVLSFFQNSIISEIILNTLESASQKKIQKRQFFILKNISCQFKIFKIQTAARRISPQAALYISRRSFVALQYIPKDETILPITVCTEVDLQEARQTAAVRHVIFGAW